MDDLKAKILASKEAGCKPLMILATAGTTVSGTFDPLEKIVDLATEHGIWVHVDLCWGGGAVFSTTHKHLVKGLDRVDSCAFALHKNLSVPTQCALFITPHQGILRESNAAGAAYLFQKSGPAALDIGDKSIQCSRRNDALKCWATWRAIGDKGFTERADRSFALANLMKEKLEKHPCGKFQLAFPVSGLNVCWWYVPTWMKGFDPATATDSQKTEIADITAKMKVDITAHGGFMLTVTPLIHILPKFFRAVFPGAHQLKDTDLDLVLDQIVQSAARLGYDKETAPQH